MTHPRRIERVSADPEESRGAREVTKAWYCPSIDERPGECLSQANDPGATAH